ncbi:MAG: hypothetical protein H0V63_05525 [Burkholderiaceae bacterium]|nr:hypothetical protein [Burkholderiaceae bacterium]
MPATDFLDSKHSLYVAHEAAWKREERRLVGGDAILPEVVQFAHEDSTSYAARQAWARWMGFGRLHTAILSGHIRRQLPIPNYGKLGEVRGRAESSDSLAGLFHYNCDGVGSDGQQLDAWLDGVEQRALATGYRWLMMEMPTRGTLRSIRRRIGSRDPDAEQATDEEVRAGFRPFVVEYSPVSVTNWRIIDGVLVWAIIRVAVDPVMDVGTAVAGAGLGYYLLVREGYTGLGDEYQEGGWWKYDPTKTLLPDGHGTWADTGGDIPLWLHIGEPGRGTVERPSIGTSSTMELGQISADLMNAISEQRFNLRQAAKSINYWTGTDKIVDDAMKVQLGDGSMSVAIGFARAPDGTYHVPTLVNSSSFALDADAYQGVIESAVREAREIMVRQITSEPGSSGVSKEAGFAEATSPLLARIAATAEQSLNTLLYFLARRFGLSFADAMELSITIGRDFSLRDVQADIDTMLGLLEKSGQRSPTWERALLIAKGEALDVLPEEDFDRITAELADRGDDKAALERSLLQAQVVKAWIEAGATDAGAAEEAGLDLERARRLFTATTEEPEPAADPVVVPAAEVPATTVEEPVPVEEAA